MKRLVLQDPAIWADNARTGRALQLARNGHVKPNGDGTWTVRSQRGRDSYTVVYDSKDCNCIDHADKGNVCKHWQSVALVM